MVKIYIYNEMKKQNIPEEIFSLITEEEIIMFQELQIKIKELNNKTNLTRLINGDDYWVSQVFDSIWPFKTFPNINFDNKKFLDIGSGCGFPGLAYAITHPTSEIYLVDSSKKKTDALKVLIKEFANIDISRAVTHNKGIMNGIIALAIATGQDTRALESAIHSYASLTGRYIPLTNWKKDSAGNLSGQIKLPVPVGVVGGISSVHPSAKICLNILGIKSASGLGEIMASVGLAQNFAAIYALASEGIQTGHMTLHSRNLATSAGASGDLVDKIANIMIDEKNVNFQRAKELLNQLDNS